MQKSTFQHAYMQQEESCDSWYKTYFFFLLTNASSHRDIKLVFLNLQTMGFSKKIFPHLNKCSYLNNRWQNQYNIVK